jgi:hypothetical protein
VRSKLIGSVVVATALLTPATAVSSLERIVSVQSPSHNIACILASRTDARCDIKAHTWHVGRPKGCVDLNYGDSLSVNTRGRVYVTCHGDTTFDPKAKVLAYGRSISDGPFTCASATSGITCRDRRTRHGFLISKARIRLF